MSIFNRHKHTYKFLSADNLTRDAVHVGDYILDHAVYTTVVIEQCTGCHKLRERHYSGHHAEAIKEGWDYENEMSV